MGSMSIVVPCQGCRFLNCLALDKVGSIQTALLWTWAKGIYNYITENGGKKCAPDCSPLAVCTVDCITLAALYVFFLKWTEPCLLLWDALLLFRKVTGEIVVDEWAAARETLWPSGVSAGLGGRVLHFNPGSAAHSWLFDLQGDGGVCFPHLCPDTPLDVKAYTL